ncbi:MAG: hypothetical protein QNJ13_15145 [Paracoccaceae bacterium]|nr:hypothetical protein [Paracoccaceae bacterium]
MSGDISVAYQARRDLLDEDQPELRDRVAGEGCGRAMLDAHHPGGWGQGFYQPKWTSSHYTLLDLRLLELAPDHPIAQAEVARILAKEHRPDGGVGPARSSAASDVCVNGMVLNYASYFGAPEAELRRIVDFIAGQQMRDGGFNCRKNRFGARHSSVHSTASVLEGIASYLDAGHSYRADELRAMAEEGLEFLLLHRFFRSDRTGDVINPAFLRLPYPWRWFYNILRGLDCARRLGAGWDPRMEDAVAVLRRKRRADGRWPVNAEHKGQVHVVMEAPGGPSRWNTLIALRVFRHFGIEP